MAVNVLTNDGSHKRYRKFSVCYCISCFGLTTR